ncbi:DUF4367 domain-containing protein [Heliorestis acidaminivorans]|uniref:DUF4367 domain-containing protein n=1 Tax=Heliorestis acidaminivorans TaxID=553427 RepID=A0A6I0F077_9FIRM|nr:DUF4367 domain-containing protein [Heliorestis acidaminivorans]KAB2952671.1 DUF4367 domain-containing protein [Heliorestis acidaminivorans]
MDKDPKQKKNEPIGDKEISHTETHRADRNKEAEAKEHKVEGHKARMDREDEKKDRIEERKDDRSKWIAGAVAAVLLVGLFTMTPLRQAAADFLAQFRAQRIEIVEVNPQQMQHLAQNIQTQVGEIDLQQFGKVDVREKPVQNQLPLAEARKQIPFPVKTPAFVPELFRLNEPVTIHQGGHVAFTLDVNQVNALLQQLGAQTLLPENLQNKTFEIAVPKGIRMQYIHADEEQQFNISQFNSPEINVPGGVDEIAVRNALLDLPVLPEELRSQLAAIDDWKNTAIVPYVEGQMDRLEINGQEALYGLSPRGMGHLMWMDNGVIMQMHGNLDKETLIQIAQSLR